MPRKSQYHNFKALIMSLFAQGYSLDRVRQLYPDIPYTTLRNWYKHFLVVSQLEKLYSNDSSQTENSSHIPEQEEEDMNNMNSLASDISYVKQIINPVDRMNITTIKKRLIYFIRDTNDALELSKLVKAFCDILNTEYSISMKLSSQIPPKVEDSSDNKNTILDKLEFSDE